MSYEAKLPFAGRFSRLRARLRDPEWRRFGALLLAGKGLGLALLLAGIGCVSIFTGHTVHAADAPTVNGADVVNPINTVWTLVAAFLVLGGSELGRWVGVVAAGLGGVAAMFWAPYYPVWALIYVGLGALVMYALLVYGGSDYESMEEPVAPSHAATR